MASVRELSAQTAMRGIASIAVFFAHAHFDVLFPALPILAQVYIIFLWHNVAVDLFFELSGFILCYVYCSKKFSWKGYFLARFARIYPIFFVTLSICLASRIGDLLLSRYSSDTTPWGVVMNLFLVQDWPFLPHVDSINPPTWSISVEVFLYICLFPLLFHIRRHLPFWFKVILAVVR